MGNVYFRLHNFKPNIMKTNTKLVFVLLLSAFLITYACADHTGGTNKSPKDPPSILLSYTELLDMLQHYDETRKNQFANALNIQEDTRINYFKLEDLKAYIRYMEKESKKKGITLEGINFIAASYPDDKRSPLIKRNYQTLIMMPATTVGGEEMVSFDPFLSEKGSPALLKDILKRFDPNYNWVYDSVVVPSATKKKSARSKSGGDGLSPGGNRAGITPPM